MVGLDPLLIYVACCSFGVLVGALLTGFGLQLRHARKKHRLEQSQLELREQMKHLDHSRQDAKNEVLQLREDLGKSQDSLSSIQTRAAGFESTIKALESQIAGAQENPPKSFHALKSSLESGNKKHNSHSRLVARNHPKEISPETSDPIRS